MIPLFALFGAAFLAATLLPAQSEILLGTLIVQGEFSPYVLIAIATLGNTLGSCVNWLLGRFCMRFQHASWFPIKESMRQKAESWYGKYGRWSLLLSWMPIIGDPLTFAAGLMRENFYFFVVIVGLAKCLRYVFIAAIALGIF